LVRSNFFFAICDSRSSYDLSDRCALFARRFPLPADQREPSTGIEPVTSSLPRTCSTD
jgi:hypothetical protein